MPLHRAIASLHERNKVTPGLVRGRAEMGAGRPQESRPPGNFSKMSMQNPKFWISDAFLVPETSTSNGENIASKQAVDWRYTNAVLYSCYYDCIIYDYLIDRRHPINFLRWRLLYTCPSDRVAV